MKYELTKGTGSYEVKIVVDAKIEAEMREGALKLAQKDFAFQGFRKGHVPMNIVEKNLKPEYLQMALYEETINKALQQIVTENSTLQFIGQPYDLNDAKDDKGRTITFKLDVYPEAEVTGDAWKSLHIAPFEAAPTAEEEATALNNLKRQYADYQDTDVITEDSVAKIKYVMKDKDGNDIDTGSSFLGKEEYDESALLKKEFVGQKKDAVVEFAYDEKKLPHVLHFHPKDEAKKALKAATVSATIVDIKTVILPDLNNEEVVKKLFASEEIKNEADLKKKIGEVLAQQKRENMLHEAVEKVMEETKKSMTVTISHTILREEMTARIKQLGQRMGGEEGMKQYFEKMGEEGTKKIYDDVELSARTSLEKFFMLRKLTELLEIKDIDRNTNLDAEEKLYAKLSTGKAKAAKPAAAKEEADKDEEPKAPKKKPAAK